MSKKILIIDDNEDILLLMQDILSANGYEVYGLVFTENIIKEVAAISPDLVILDFLLAGVNGGELCSN